MKPTCEVLRFEVPPDGLCGGGPSETVKAAWSQRDRLWCTVLLADLDLRDVAKVLKTFNENRPDNPTEGK